MQVQHLPSGKLILRSDAMLRLSLQTFVLLFNSPYSREVQAVEKMSRTAAVEIQCNYFAYGTSSIISFYDLFKDKQPLPDFV